MKFVTGTRSSGWFGDILHEIFQPRQSAPVTCNRIGQLTRQGLAVVLSALMIMIPMGQGDAFAQSAPLPSAGSSAAPDTSDVQQAPRQPLSDAQLDQLVAPIALYPDALVAQVLGAATYPTQVVEADRWRQAQGNASPEQIAAGADTHSWDPSVKALTAFPTVLAQMDRNVQWTTELGDAYYNQPQDVMDSVQAMRRKAQNAGQLRSTPQLAVNSDGDAITIAPANPTVVYVPVYNPWVVYGSPFPIYPGYYYEPPLGVFFGGLALGFGIGIGIGVFSHWGWGWDRWGMGWHDHSVFFNHNNFMTRSTTVTNHGFNRPGGPRGEVGARGAFNNRPGRNDGRPNMGSRGGYGANRPGGNHNNRPGMGNRGGYGASRPGSNGGNANNRGNYASNRAGGNSGRPAGNYGRNVGASNRPASYGRPDGSYGRSGGNYARSGGNYARSGGNYARSGESYGRPSGGGRQGGYSQPSMGRGSSPSYGGGHQSGGGYPSGSHQGGGGGHQSSGGYQGGGGGHSGGGGGGGGHPSGGGGGGHQGGGGGGGHTGHGGR